MLQPRNVSKLLDAKWSGPHADLNPDPHIEHLKRMREAYEAVRPTWSIAGSAPKKKLGGGGTGDWNLWASVPSWMMTMLMGIYGHELFEQDQKGRTKFDDFLDANPWYRMS